MKKLKKKSYNWTYNAIQKLSKHILKLEKKGNTNLISLNLDNQNTINYLSFLDKKEAFSKEIPVVDDMIKSISKKTPFFTLLVTGSYAVGNQRKNSDIDVVIIIDDQMNEKTLIPYIKDISRLSLIEIDYHVIKKSDFYKMLINEEENFGKELFRKHLLFYGVDSYYQIIKEAVKNGLQRKI
ncbi:MAG: hypothetical protein MAG795_00831 [Candidatus Woesearchaeota archaeon]|nr:hypothetical protein [Candidatus Woesearchaeota archaeon]